MDLCSTSAHLEILYKNESIPHMRIVLGDLVYVLPKQALF